MEKEEFDFERFKEEAMRGLYQGKKMGGTDGVFAPILKHLLESMLEGELDHHLQESKASQRLTVKTGRQKRLYGAFRPDISNWRAVEIETALSSQR